MYLNFRVCFFRAGSTYLFTLVAVKKQIAMLLNTLHFKDCRGSINIITLAAVEKQIAMLLNTTNAHIVVPMIHIVKKWVCCALSKQYSIQYANLSAMKLKYIYLLLFCMKHGPILCRTKFWIS